MTYAKPRVGVKRALFTAILLLLPLSSGCLEVPTVRPCPDNTCFPLTSEAFDALIMEDGSFDGSCAEFLHKCGFDPDA